MLSKIDIKYFKLAVGTAHMGKELDNDIAVRCPICGDSRKKKNSKRLHLYKKNEVTNISCFNGGCPVVNKTVYSFLRDFFPALLSGYKREMFQQQMVEMSSGTSDVFQQFNKKEKNDEIKEPKNEIGSNIVTQDLSEFLTPLVRVPEGVKYLKNRKIKYKQSYGAWYFGYQNLKINDVVYNITDSIVIPLYVQDKMYGFYSRNITNKFFATHMNDSNIGYKVWNWFNIDKSKPVYIFEGIFDAISSGLDNIVACMGSKIPQERLNELTEPVFVLDNDRTGLFNSLKYAEKYKVYIQPNKYPEKDMNELFTKYRKNLNIPSLIKDNIFSGIFAQVKIKGKL